MDCSSRVVYCRDELKLVSSRVFSYEYVDGFEMSLWRSKLISVTDPADQHQTNIQQQGRKLSKND